MKSPYLITKNGELLPINTAASLISHYLTTVIGKQRLAYAMGSAIRSNLFSINPIVESVVKLHTEFPITALKTKPRTKFKYNIYAITHKGEFGKPNYIWGSRVTVPQFEIFANPSIRLGDITARRFSLIDRYSDPSEKLKNTRKDFLKVLSLKKEESKWKSTYLTVTKSLNRLYEFLKRKTTETFTLSRKTRQSGF